MKHIYLFFLVVIFILCSSCSSIDSLCDYKVVYVDDTVHMIETGYGDSNAIRLINSVDIIVRGTVVSSSKLEYVNLGFHEFAHKVKISEVLKGEDIISVGDEIQVNSHCGYVSFAEYIRSSSNSSDARLQLTEKEITEYSSDPEAMVAIAEQNGTPIYEGGEFVLLLCYDENDGSQWTVWSDRSSVMEVIDGNLIGYATAYLGKTYEDLVETFELAEKTPEIKYDLEYIFGIQNGTISAEEYYPDN